MSFKSTKTFQQFGYEEKTKMNTAFVSTQGHPPHSIAHISVVCKHAYTQWNKTHCKKGIQWLFSNTIIIPAGTDPAELDMILNLQFVLLQLLSVGPDL